MNVICSLFISLKLNEWSEYITENFIQNKLIKDANVLFSQQVNTFFGVSFDILMAAAYYVERQSLDGRGV